MRVGCPHFTDFLLNNSFSKKSVRDAILLQAIKSVPIKALLHYFILE
jgi:hypothetical protein